VRLVEDHHVIGWRCKCSNVFSLPVLIVPRLDHKIC
jgi:hypothetical protein